MNGSLKKSQNENVLELNIKENIVSTGYKQGSTHRKVIVIW